jgi:hypothetical protein
VSSGNYSIVVNSQDRTGVIIMSQLSRVSIKAILIGVLVDIGGSIMTGFILCIIWAKVV